MVEKIRRVVTAHDDKGRSVFVIDGAAGTVRRWNRCRGSRSPSCGARTARRRQLGAGRCRRRSRVLEPGPNGTVFRIVEFPPDSAWRDRADARDAFDSIDAGHAPDAASDDPMMHKTSTVDYLIVLKGEIWAILDTGEVCLKAGDVMIQRGTNHSWSVRADEPCLLAAVLFNAEPV